jgi:hypothetical protein
MNIGVIGIRGYGITHGCCDIFSNVLYYKCSIEEFGNLLYEILNKHPFEEYYIEYNIDTSALHYQNDDIVRPACITKEDAEIYG